MKGLTYFLYTAAASVVMTWAAHNPAWHDPALWLLGVLGHAIGYTHGSGNDSGSPAPVLGTGQQTPGA